jgi:1,4-dihydroxy-6-naphthoate synthase
MFYALARNQIPTGPYRFEHILQDIQTLNDWALEGRLELTAVSIHAYAYIHDRYALLDCGASMGERYGPLLVARAPIALDRLAHGTIAVPGTTTTAFLVLCLMLGTSRFQYKPMPFDAILQAVADGQADAGLIIHEGQLTYTDLGLCKLVDLGQWWFDQTHLPLPLGGNVIRRDLPAQALRDVPALLRQSIHYALDHRPDALQYALQFARHISPDLADRFIGMYVNQWTLGYGPVGRHAVRELLDRAHKAGLTPPVSDLDFLA